MVLDICSPPLIQFHEKATNQRGKASVSLVCVSFLCLMLVLYAWNLILELETLIMKYLIKKSLTNKTSEKMVSRNEERKKFLRKKEYFRVTLVEIWGKLRKFVCSYVFNGVDWNKTTLANNIYLFIYLSTYTPTAPKYLLIYSRNLICKVFEKEQ